MALDLTDYSGHSNTLTNNNAVSLSTDVPVAGWGASAAFVAASSQYLSITDAAQTGLGVTATFTAQFWFKATTNSINQTVFDKATGSLNTSSYRAIFTAANALDPVIWDNASHQYEYTAGSLVASAWHHWTITCNSANSQTTKFEFFLDGTSIGNGTVAVNGAVTTINTCTAPFTLGANYNGSTFDTFLNGLLADVRFFNIVRSSAAISGDYQQRLTGSESGLVGYWPFENVTIPGAASGMSSGSIGLLFPNR